VKQNAITHNKELAASLERCIPALTHRVHHCFLHD